MTCQHRYLDHPDGSLCTLDDHPQNPGGHVYKGPSFPDAHDLSEAAAEGTRG